MEYELMLLFKPLTNEDIKERIFPKIEKSVKELKGTIKINDSFGNGKRLLAYDMDSNKEGYYLLCDLSISSANLTKLMQKLTLTAELIRCLNIKKTEL